MGGPILRILVERKARRPRAGARRSRSVLRITAAVTLAAAVGAAVWGALLFAAAGRPVRFDTVRAGAAVHRAEQLLREPAPRAAAHLAELRGRAEAPPPAELPDAGQWEEVRAVAWGEALRYARSYAVDEIGRRGEARQRWSVLEPEAARALERAREQVKAPGIGRRDAAHLQIAEVKMATARQFAAVGDDDRAAEAAEAVLFHTAKIEERWRELHARFQQPELLARWRKLVADTLDESRRTGRFAVIVDKLGRRLEVYSAGRVREALSVELGSQGLSQKLHAGDRATPEGRYRVTSVKVAPATRYYKALLIDYPNAEDRRRFNEARRRGEIPAAVGIGGLIEIHGDGGRGNDWTDGCVALANADMDRLFRYVAVGTPVTIVGTVPRGAD